MVNGLTHQNGNMFCLDEVFGVGHSHPSPPSPHTKPLTPPPHTRWKAEEIPLLSFQPHLRHVFRLFFSLLRL